MFRTFAIASADLLDAAKRAAWDKLLSDFEIAVEAAGCTIVVGNSSAVGDILQASFHVRKDGYGQVAMTPQGPVTGKLRGAESITAEAFEAALKRTEPGDGTGRPVRADPAGPRILR